MKLHEDKELFGEFLREIYNRTGIDLDILEKDYYVCMVLKEIALKQSEMNVYFKGGTAVYKILPTMNRFSEDIDLTYKPEDSISKNQNRKRLESTATEYNIKGLKNINSIKSKDSVTAFYEYESAFNEPAVPLQRNGKIQIESTAFTISEPTNEYTVEPLILKLANENERKILNEKYDIKEIKIKTITLERMFIDKIFAAEFYYIRGNKNVDFAKHVFDICTLLDNKDISSFLKDKKRISKVVLYKRLEERNRIGGVDENLKIKDFKYLNEELSKERIEAINILQDKYVLKEEYKFKVDEIKNKLKILKELFESYDM